MSQGATPDDRGVPAGKGKAVDWEAIERDYRAGVLSVREIAKQYGCSHVGIAKRAARDGWSRDLTDQVQAKAQRRLAELAVTKAVTKFDASGNPVTKPSDAQIVDAAAATIVQVVSSHRRDLSVARFLATTLMSQLMEVSESRDDLEQAIVEATPEAEAGGKGADPAARAMRARMLRAVSLPANASTLRDLSTAMRNFMLLERLAFNVKDGIPPPDPGESERRATVTDYAKLRQALTIEDGRVVA